MRRRSLAPARRVLMRSEVIKEDWHPEAGAPPRSRGRGARALGRRVLSGPGRARPEPRRFLDPVGGWFRRLERTANRYLTHWIFSHLPWMDRIYAQQLDRFLTVSEAEVAIPGLPSPFDGVTVLLITDLHAGPFLSRDALQRTFDRLSSLSPDLILLGGDLTTTRVADLEPHREALASLSAPLGAYAVPGNHEHYTDDPDGVGRILEGAGIGWLCNRSTWLERRGSRVLLAGIDDLNAGEPDLDRALETSGGVHAPRLLLSHNPDVFFEAARRGVSLVLAGHTHGGQIRIPGLPVLVRMSRYRLDHGRYAVEGSELVVSRGLGATGLPLRVACSPEAILVTLRPGQKHPEKLTP